MARRTIRTVAVALFVMLVAPIAGQAKVITPPIGTLNQRTLVCSVSNHRLTVGSAYALRKGTQIYFTAKLENAGTYARSIPLPRDIPAHLSITITGLPVLDSKAGCRAWWFRRPVVAPPR